MKIRSVILNLGVKPFFGGAYREVLDPTLQEIRFSGSGMGQRIWDGPFSANFPGKANAANSLTTSFKSHQERPDLNIILNKGILCSSKNVSICYFVKRDKVSNCVIKGQG